MFHIEKNYEEFIKENVLMEKLLKSNINQDSKNLFAYDFQNLILYSFSDSHLYSINFSIKNNDKVKRKK